MSVKKPLILAIALAVVALIATHAFATPEFAASAGKQCLDCHVSAEGGELNSVGKSFQANGYKWAEGASYEALAPMGNTARAVVGFIHFVAGFLWFGTILYVHILLRPAYAIKGLLRGEVTVGLVSMVAVGLSGLVLTLSRIHGFDVFVETGWGILLLVKIALYTVMVSTALFVVTYLGPRLRKARHAAAHPEDGVFGPRSLSAFDGKDGAPAYVAYKGKVYDVTASSLWKKGEHFRKHVAGMDLTASMPLAPHGPEKLGGIKEIGVFDLSLPARLTPPQKLFYVVAYMNLGLVFLVLLVIAFWRWGL